MKFFGLFITSTFAFELTDITYLPGDSGVQTISDGRYSPRKMKMF